MASDNTKRQPAKKKNESVAEVQKVGLNTEKVREFVAEVGNEYQKIAWPDKKHTVGSTAVVSILVTIIAFYLAAVDLFLGKMVGYILK